METHQGKQNDQGKEEYLFHKTYPLSPSYFLPLNIMMFTKMETDFTTIFLIIFQIGFIK